MNWGLLCWQAAISVGVYIVIRMNGSGWIHGWLCGAVVQVLNLSYGALTHQYGFLLSAIPALAFLEVYRRKLNERGKGSPGRDRHRRRLTLRRP